MKYSVKLTREDGKTVILAANEWIDIDVQAGNHRIAALTLRDETLYNENDDVIVSVEKKGNACRFGHAVCLIDALGNCIDKN